MLGRRKGAIVNISSIAAVRYTGYPYSAYYAAKAGINQFTVGLALQHARDGIRVNAVAPGPGGTEGTEGMREAQGYLASLAPAKRLGTAEEIAAAIVYLASPGAAFTQGVVLPVDGGRVAV